MHSTTCSRDCRRAFGVTLKNLLKDLLQRHRYTPKVQNVPRARMDDDRMYFVYAHGS